MLFKPYNRHLHVLPLEEEPEADEIVIITPDDYSVPQSPYLICDVLDIADDCTIELDIGDTVIIERRMLHEIKAQNETIYIVPQNYVYGRINNG